MNINRNNYEKYFIDYLDGTLSPGLVHDLRTFLLLNEDLSAVLEGIEKTKLTPPSLKYAFKENLKKDFLHACPDYYAIAWADNSLTSEDQTYLNHSSHKKEVEKEGIKYQQLKLKPDTTIHYPKKSKLYHPSYRKLWYRYCSAAAILLFMLSSGILLLQPRDQIQPSPLPIILPIAEEIIPIKYNITRDEKIQNVIPQSTIKPNSLPIERVPIAQIRKLPTPKVIQTTTNEWNRIQVVSSQTVPELILSENAIAWKPSENNFFADNIFSSAVHAGKIITERIKNNTTQQ